VPEAATDPQPDHQRQIAQSSLQSGEENNWLYGEFVPMDYQTAKGIGAALIQAVVAHPLFGLPLDPHFLTADQSRLRRRQLQARKRRHPQKMEEQSH
jgi:hypothetical protein